MTTAASEPTPGPPSPLPSDEGYQPVRQEAGEPIVPRSAVAAPQPIGITMQPPRRGLPTPDEGAPSGPEADDEGAGDLDARADDADGEPGRVGTDASTTTDTAARSNTDTSSTKPANTVPADADASNTDPEDAAPSASSREAADETADATSSPYARPSGQEDSPHRMAPKPDEQTAVGELITKLNEPAAPRATRGWRAMLNLGPSEKEKAELADLTALRRHFDRPITIMVANPKGGVGKTPLTLLLASAFGTARGGGVVAWDNNELRGTMPDRSVSAHRRSVRDLLAAAPELNAPSAGFTDVAQLLNHQTSGNFHTLGSTQATGQSISRADFDSVHGILSRFFEIIVVDTGNNEAASNWRAAADTADCLVVPTKWRKDSLIPAARMLESLTESNPKLLERTLIVATNAPAEAQRESRKAAGKWFGSRHLVLEIPTDPHIAEGDVLSYERLMPGTRRAAQEVAAAIVKLLG